MIIIPYQEVVNAVVQKGVSVEDADRVLRSFKTTLDLGVVDRRLANEDNPTLLKSKSFGELDFVDISRRTFLLPPDTGCSIAVANTVLTTLEELVRNSMSEEEEKWVPVKVQNIGTFSVKFEPVFTLDVETKL